LLLLFYHIGIGGTSIRIEYQKKATARGRLLLRLLIRNLWFDDGFIQ